MTLPDADAGLSDPLVIEQVRIQAKYQGYIDRQQDEVARNLAHEETELPGLDYATVPGLSKEVQQKLKQHQPPDARAGSRIRASRRRRSRCCWCI